jgi:hypothetical protein
VDLGYRGGLSCPYCDTRVKYWPRYPEIVHLITLPILLFVLASGGIYKGWVFSIKAVVEWYVGSIMLSVLISQIKPPILKQDHSLDKNAPPSMFDK